MLPTQSIGPFQVPAFSRISISQWEAHLKEAHDKALADLKALEDPDLPLDFAHTFLGMERLFRDLGESLQLFFATLSPHATPEKSALAEKWIEPVARLESCIYQSVPLYERCVQVQRQWPQAPQAERRLMEHHLRAFRNAGQGLSPADRERLGAINAELARCGLEFQDLCREAGAVVVVLAEEAAWGLPPQDVEAARHRARKRGQHGLGFVLQPMQVEGWLAAMAHRPSRQALWEACAQRGTGVRDTDTRPLLRRILELRTQRSRLLGYPTPAHHLMEETMAGQPDKAMALLEDTWERVLPGLASDLEALVALAREDGVECLEPWDVGYYTRRYRARHFQMDESALRSYLPLSAVRQGAFEAARRVFGVRFEPVQADLYHPQAQAYQVFKDDAQEPCGLLVVDDFFRETKAPGAWMSNLRPSSSLEGRRAPWVTNVCNFQPPSDDTPALLEFDDAVTVFHELGHALHALLSTARYPSQAGTRVAQDFVELPSQIFENWFTHPQALASIARHWETGERLEESNIAAVAASRQFGQGIGLAQYLASAFLDLFLHDRPSPPEEDLCAFQDQVMYDLRLPRGIAPRHGLTHFSHLFSSDAYAAGYYSYLWAEVLEADAFTRFAGEGLCDPALGRAFRQAILEPGGSADPGLLFRQFMGRDLSVDALLAKHGLA